MEILLMPVPPMIEEAFGYSGSFRFVAFYYDPKTASLLWSLYLENARRDHERWVPNAELLRQICQRKLARIDAEKGAPRPGPRSKPGRHKD